MIAKYILWIGCLLAVNLFINLKNFYYLLGIVLGVKDKKGGYISCFWRVYNLEKKIGYRGNES